jgi:hypothetical protein
MIVGTGLLLTLGVAPHRAEAQPLTAAMCTASGGAGAIYCLGVFLSITSPIQPRMASREPSTLSTPMARIPPACAPYHWPAYVTRSG